MDAIREALIVDVPEASSRLLPTTYVKKADILPSREISEAFRHLTRESTWGPQYEWLARLADSQDVRLEIGLKADDRPVARLKQYLVKGSDGLYAIAAPLGTPAATVFNGFALPLVELTKLGMLQEAESAGFRHVLEMTWFCQHPTLRGDACGMCVPCQHYREEGLGQRVPPVPGLLGRLEFHIVNKSWGLFTRARRLFSSRRESAWTRA